MRYDMKYIVVRSKKEWAESPHYDEKKLRGLTVVEDPRLPPRTFQVAEREL